MTTIREDEIGIRVYRSGTTAGRAADSVQDGDQFWAIVTDFTGARTLWRVTATELTLPTQAAVPYTGAGANDDALPVMIGRSLHRKHYVGAAHYAPDDTGHAEYLCAVSFVQDGDGTTLADAVDAYGRPTDPGRP